MGSVFISEYTVNTLPNTDVESFVGGRNMLAIFQLLREGRNIWMMEKTTLRNNFIFVLFTTY
jgi:hypothetical protein